MKSDTWIITGTGVISSLGVGARQHVEAFGPLAADSARTAKAPEDFSFVLSAPLPDPISIAFPTGASPGTCRLIAAAEQATQAAGLLERTDPQEVGVVVATCYGNLRSVAAFQRDVQREGPRFVMPTHFPNTVMSTASGQVAIPWGFTGINTTISAGPASGLEALATASDLLGTHHSPAILCCGYEEISPELIAAYQQTGCVSSSCRTSIPFHPDSRGFLLGEAAAAVVLESNSKPEARALAEYAGYGGAYVSSKESSAVKLAARIHAMREALSVAEVTPEGISLVLASANGQPGEDQIEALALSEVFGSGLARLPVIALKGLIGECFAATGLVQVALASILLREGCLPSRFVVLEKNHGVFVAQPRESKLKEHLHAILINAYDPCGMQSSVVIKRWRV